MTLQLVTGPTNARKAGVVLGLVRRWASAGRRPVLVVPTGSDADVYRRELLGLAGGVVTGVRVVTPDGLARLARRAAGLPPAELGALTRDRLLVAGLRSLGPERPLAAALDRPRLRGRLDALLEELAERGLGLADLEDALGRVDLADATVDPHLVADLRIVVRGMEEAARAGGLDGERSPGAVAVEVRRALVAGGWRAPVALYGFDDLTFGQQALLRVLARGADVVVSLPFEDGRRATAARRDLVEELRRTAEELPEDGPGRTGLLPLRAGAEVLAGSTVARIGRREVVLAGGPAESGRARLAASLFEPRAAAPPGTADGDVLGDVVTLAGGDARAEAEGLAHLLAEAVDEHGLAWHDVAIAARDAGGVGGARLERALATLGVPVARPRQEPAQRTGVGRALLSLLALRTGDGDADDVVRVATELLPAAPEVRDDLDAWAIGLRRGGVERAAPALERAAALLDGTPAAALLERAVAPDDDAAAAVLLLRDALPVLVDAQPATGGDEDVVARAAAAIDRWLAELEELARRSPALLPTAAELRGELGQLPVPAGRAPGPGRVEIAEPAALRGRHLAVLALAGLDEAAFPAPEPVDPLVDRETRAVLAAAAGGALLAVPAERLAAERMLFLELVARPTRLLVLSRPEATERGEPRPPSPFLADIAATLAPARPRTLARSSALVAPPDRRSTATPGPLGSDLDAVGRETVRRVLLERSRFTVREVERLARCPVCWLVEHLAGARDDRPETEPQRHGQLVHEVLQRAIVEVAGGAGHPPYAALDRDALLAAGRRALDELGPVAVAGLPPHRAAVLRRRADTGVAAVLGALGERYGEARLEAVELRIDDDGDVPPLDLGDGARAVGRVDRVDRVPLPGEGEGIGVVDYKLGGGGAVPATRWGDTATIQAGAYLAAVAAAGGDPPAYALYQPAAPRTGVLTGARPPAGLEHRGALSASRGRGPKDVPGVQAALDELLAQARAAVAALRAGGITPTADGSVHGRDGGCDHPAIARLW